MAVTPSKPLPLGSTMPEFQLTDAVSGQAVSSDSIATGRGILVMFICNHCPYVIHIRGELVRVAHEALDQGVGVVAINANSLRTYPQDGPLHMKELAVREGFRFPFAFDADQSVARAFDAACTPDLYLFDGARKLVYHGQFDASRPGKPEPVTGRDLREAISAVVAGRLPHLTQIPSIGCNIKWEA